MITLKSRPICLTLVAMLGLGTLVVPQRLHAEDLHWKFKVGDRFELAIDQKVVQKTEVLLKPVEVETKTHMTVRWEVTAVNPDGSAKMSQTFESLALRVTSDEADDLEYDSTLDKQTTTLGTELARDIGPFLKTPLQVTMTPQGVISKVEASEESLEKIREANGSMRLRKALTVEGLQEMLSLITTPLPVDEVQVGDAWQQERVSQTGGIQLNVVHDFTYRGPQPLLDQTVDKIEFVTRLEQPAAEEKEAQRGPEIESQEASGVFWFDREQGNPVLCEQKQTLVTKQPLREFNISVSATSETVCKLKRLAGE